MCQSIANGGWRCATHEPGNNAMASWAHSTTGLPLHEARTVFMTLKEEGEDAADPTRDEVVDFLTTQEFRVRNAEALTEPRRARILTQLRSALTQAWEKILPDGPTFQAWKNVASECWSRAKRKMAVSFLLGGLSVASLTGCGGTQALGAQDTTPAPATTTSSVVVTPGPTTGATHERTVMTVNDAQFNKNTISGPAVTEFGSAKANAAYKAAVLFAMNNSLDGPSLTKTGPITDADLAPAKAAMTPKAYASLKSYAAKANAGDLAAKAQVFVVMSKDLLGGSDWTYRPGANPVVSSKTFGPATGASAWTPPGSTSQQISMQFKTTTNYQLLDDKKQPITIRVVRNMGFSMENVGTKWLIGGWEIKQTSSTNITG